MIESRALDSSSFFDFLVFKKFSIILFSGFVELISDLIHQISKRVPFICLFNFPHTEKNVLLNIIGV